MDDLTLPNLTVQQLEYLVAAAGSPTRAAAAASLGERRVGVPLFERHGRYTRPRSQATEVLAHARRVVAETRDLARWAEAQRTGRAGVVRLGTIDVVAVHYRAEVIRRHRREVPGLDLRLTVAPSGVLLDALLVGDLDLVVCVEPTGLIAGVTTSPCLDEPIHAYAPDGVHAGPPEEWGPWVTYPQGSHTREVIAAGLAAIGAPFIVVAESNQPEVLREMVRFGMGWAVLSEAQAESGAEPLVRVRRRPVGTRRLVVARRADMVADAAVDALAGALVAG